jgi:hypothetical protein
MDRALAGQEGVISRAWGLEDAQEGAALSIRVHTDMGSTVFAHAVARAPAWDQDDDHEIDAIPFRRGAFSGCR